MDKLYGTRKAAEYLGISLSAMKQHVARGNLKPAAQIGDSNAFTQEQLDAFRAERRSPGRPKQKRLAPRAAAEYLGITLAELHQLIADSKIKPHDAGGRHWFTQQQLDKWKEQQS